MKRLIKNLYKVQSLGSFQSEWTQLEKKMKFFQKRMVQMRMNIEEVWTIAVAMETFAVYAVKCVASAHLVLLQFFSSAVRNVLNCADFTR